MKHLISLSPVIANAILSSQVAGVAITMPKLYMREPGSLSAPAPLLRAHAGALDSGIRHAPRAPSPAEAVLNMLGDAVRDLLDPRLTGGAGRLSAHGAEGARSV